MNWMQRRFARWAPKRSLLFPGNYALGPLAVDNAWLSLDSRPDDAARIASSLLDEIAENPIRHSRDEWHSAHLILGHVHLAAGDVDSAVSELLIAVQDCKGDPVMLSFGPDMSLAKRLLELGASPTPVLAYLDACSEFWIMPGAKRRIGRWSATISSGGIPDFGPNSSPGLTGARVRSDEQSP
jgi:hypothetical protein